jgi:hypothetical protein
LSSLARGETETEILRRKRRRRRRRRINKRLSISRGDTYHDFL